MVCLIGSDVSRAEGLVKESRRGSVLLHLCRKRVGETIFVFAGVGCAPIFRVEHVLHGGPLEGGEDIAFRMAM